MATYVKTGMISDGIRNIGRADYVHVLLHDGKRPVLSVTEHADTRLLPISRQVAEVLIARGMGYGN